MTGCIKLADRDGQVAVAAQRHIIVPLLYFVVGKYTVVTVCFINLSGTGHIYRTVGLNIKINTRFGTDTVTVGRNDVGAIERENTFHRIVLHGRGGTVRCSEHIVFVLLGAGIAGIVLRVLLAKEADKAK